MSTVSAPSPLSAPSPVSALTRFLYNSIPLIHDNVESCILSTTSQNPATYSSAVPTYLHIFQSSHAFLRSSNLFTHFPIQPRIPPSPPISHSFSSPSSPRFPVPCIFHNSQPLLIYKFCLRYVIFKKNIFIGKRITL